MDRDHQERVISAHFQSNPGAATFVFTACSAALGFTRSPSSAHSQDLFLLTIFANHLVLSNFWKQVIGFQGTETILSVTFTTKQPHTHQIW